MSWPLTNNSRTWAQSSLEDVQSEFNSLEPKSRLRYLTSIMNFDHTNNSKLNNFLDYVIKSNTNDKWITAIAEYMTSKSVPGTKNPSTIEKLMTMPITFEYGVDLPYDISIMAQDVHPSHKRNSLGLLVSLPQFIDRENIVITPSIRESIRKPDLALVSNNKLNNEGRSTSGSVVHPKPGSAISFVKHHRKQKPMESIGFEQVCEIAEAEKLHKHVRARVAMASNDKGKPECPESQPKQKQQLLEFLQYSLPAEQERSEMTLFFSDDWSKLFNVAAAQARKIKLQNNETVLENGTIKRETLILKLNPDHTWEKVLKSKLTNEKSIK